MDERFDIVIVGGGFTGAALANALADGKRRILMLEARRTPTARFAGELLHPARLDVLGAPLLARLRARGADVAGFAVVPGEGAAATLLPYPSPGLAIEHRVLVDELRRAALERPGVELRLGVRAEALVDAGGYTVGVRTDAGAHIQADLVLGAEGRHSRLREQLGLPSTTRLMSFTAVLRVDGAELPHPGFGHVFLGAAGPILGYPIERASSAAQPPSSASLRSPIGGGAVRMCFDLLETCTLPGLPSRLRGEYARFVPEPLRTAMLRALDERADLQLMATHAVRTRHCVARGAALVGDSGGCSHPLTAAGMTVCLNDVRVLADELARAGISQAALQRFEERRYRFARARERLTDALYELFGHDGASGPLLRRALFHYWNGSERAREASIALLACTESSPRAFFTEWGRVLALAAAGAARGEAGPRGPVLTDLLRFAGTQLPPLLRPAS
jgi:2-polyprenyl-6-methoxyphenol hydroxylase-like FAD-dependent oxidoreductase